jgi:hypothetical protein
VAGVLVPLSGRDEWERAVDGIAHGFYHTWEHCHAMSLTTGLETFLWRFDEGGDRLVCALMVRPFDEFRDIATPPGVSGFAGGGDPDRLRAGWEGFTRQAGYVAGYIGLNPLFSPAPWRAAEGGYNSLFALDLRLSRGELLARMDRNRQRELRSYDELSGRMITDRERLVRYLRETYAEFAERALPPSLRWTPETLDAYCSAGQVLLVGLDGPDGVEAALMYGYTAHGADLLLLDASPGGRRHSAVLTWHAVERLQDLGVPLLNLGGGAHHDDAISLAKQRFGADRYALTALCEVYDPETYARLCRRIGVDPEAPGYFPAYRRTGSAGAS